MTESIEVANKINEMNVWIKQLLGKLKAAGATKAATKSAYDGAVSVAEVQLRYYSGKKLYALLQKLPNFPEDITVNDILDGGKIPANLIVKIAPGLCCEESCKMDTANSDYKNLVVKIDATEAMLNSQQSINRHLSHV